MRDVTRRRAPVRRQGRRGDSLQRQGDTVRWVGGRRGVDEKKDREEERSGRKIWDEGGYWRRV